MSFNQLMHPRNIYRVKPDYLKLKDKYPSFKEILVYYKNGKAKINFNDPQSLRLLTITLLDNDFNLKVDLPLDRLIPAVPQRLNYILWVEDLVGLLDLNPSENVTGLDIGTGPCCIFPLLGCSINKSWNFIATETDDVSYQFAVNNVNSNQLSHRIKLIKVTPDMFLTNLPTINQREGHFLMCNPPFFKDRFHNDPSECHESANGDHGDQMICDESSYSKKKPSPSNLSADIETVTSGGEVSFVMKIIEESLLLKESIKIYTVMLGHKKSCIILSQHLKKLTDVKDVMINQFYQGRTMRWGLAWTFLENLKLCESIRAAPIKRPAKKKTAPLVYPVPKDIKNINYSLQSIYRCIRHLLRDELEITNVDIIRESNHSVQMVIKSQLDTWSHQRRRRRLLSRQQRTSNASDNELKEPSEEMDLDANFKVAVDPNELKKCDNGRVEVEDAHSPGKRKLDYESDDDENSQQSYYEEDSKKAKDERQVTTIAKEEEYYLLFCTCTIRRVENDLIVLELKTKDRAKSKEATHQLFQFFKNNIN